MGEREYEPGNRLLQSLLFSTKRKNEKSARSIMIKNLGFELQKYFTRILASAKIIHHNGQ